MGQLLLAGLGDGVKPRVLVVHGIHTNDDAGWMDYMVRRFIDAGFRAEKWTYGYAYALLTRFQNPGRARKLKALVRPGDILLGHSNGCTLIWMAGQLKAPIGGAVLLNPALDTGRVMAQHIPWVNLYPNEDDTIVGLADTLFPAHPWGAQGRDGLKYEDSRYLTVFTRNSFPPPVSGHSDILSPGKIEPWTDRIITHVEVRLAQG